MKKNFAAFTPFKALAFAPLATLAFTPFVALAFAADAATPPAFEVSSSGEKPVGNINPKLSSELVLKGSRGETLNFLVKVNGAKERSGCQPYGAATWSPNPSGAAPTIRLFTMPTMDITHPSYPKAPQGKLFDPLLPASNSSFCPETGWAWGELEISPELKPGKYASKLKIGTHEIPVSLTVWKMKVPESPALPAYSELSSWNLLLSHYGAWHEGEEALRGKYFNEMRKHRLYTTKSFIAPLPVQNKGDRPTLNLNSPTPSQSFEQNNLRQTPKDAYLDFPTVLAPNVDKPETPTYFKAIQNTLASLKRPGKAMVYLWDEPKPAEMPMMLRLAKMVRANAPDLKILITTVPTPELNPLVDIYVPVIDQIDAKGFPNVATYKKLQKEGKEFWMYVSCMSHGCDALVDSGRPDMVIERPSAWVRSISWLGMRTGINAFLYYAVVDGYSKGPSRDPWKDLWDFSGNGDGTLFYPGRPGEHGFTDHEPAPSIRLKLWRESSFDAEYVRWMEALPSKPDWWRPEFEALTRSTTQWEHDYSKYQVLRDKAGEYLNGLK